VGADGRPVPAPCSPGDLAVLEELQAPEGSGGNVVAAYDSVWATAYDDAVLYQITPDA
jgi:hypothetical protein